MISTKSTKLSRAPALITLCLLIADTHGTRCLVPLPHSYSCSHFPHNDGPNPFTISQKKPSQVAFVSYSVIATREVTSSAGNLLP